jgi:flagellar export protein FliJ
MRPFRFRAQAALQLRRREHDQALVGLARAQTAVAVAHRSVEEADAAVRNIDERLKEATRSPVAGCPLDWYRSWRLRCRADRELRQQHRQACEVELRNATTMAQVTQKRVRSLEQLRDDALSAWRQAASREEQKTMDALATSRFTRRKEAV